MAHKRSYKLMNPRGSTCKRFSNLVEAFKFLKSDSPDLIPRDILRKPLKFADGYQFVRADLS